MLRAFNPWWISGTINPALCPEYRRSENLYCRCCHSQCGANGQRDSYYQKATRVGYYRGGSKNKEIDIVVDYPNIARILIEVKYREQAPVSDDDAIVEHSGEAMSAIIITKRADDFGQHLAGSGKKLCASRPLPFCISWAMQKKTAIEYRIKLLLKLLHQIVQRFYRHACGPLGHIAIFRGCIAGACYIQMYPRSIVNKFCQE